jgi:hypothetical protein
LDFLNVGLDDGLRFTELARRKTSGSSYGNLGREPEFCLTVRVRDVHVYTGLLAREEEQPELTVTEDCRCHKRNVADDRVSGI